MARGGSASYFSPQNSIIKVYRPLVPSSPSRSPRNRHSGNFRFDLQVALGWTAPHFERDFIELKTFFRSLLEKHYILELTGAQQNQEAKQKIKKAILEKYPSLFEGSKNANKLEEAMRFIKKEQTTRRGNWARTKKEREQRRRKALGKESEVQELEYMIIEDSDNSILEDLDNQVQLRDPAPSSSRSIDYAEHQDQGITKSSRKQQKIVEFWAHLPKSFASQRPIVVDTPDKNVSGPSTPPNARDKSPSPKREKSPEASRQHLMDFLKACTPPMEAWNEPLVAFGCDNMLFLESLARWDDKSLVAGLKRVKDQPGTDKKLEEIDVVFLFRNLRKRFQTRA